MESGLSLSHNIVTIDDRNHGGKELTVAHPTRRSIVCVSSTSLLELDVATGASTSEISFDLPLASTGATGSSSSCNLELLAPVGKDLVVGVCQMSNLAVWNLRTSTFECVLELERGQSSKGIAGFTTSLCREQWIFYSIEGSTSIKVLSLAAVMAMGPGDASGKDHGVPFKKISRKTTNRSSQLTALAYDTPAHLLACGSSDGSFQLWAFASPKTEDDNAGGSSSKDDIAPVTLLYTSTPSTCAPIIHLAFGSSTCAPNSSSSSSSSLHLLVAYQNRVIEVWSLAPLLVARRPREPQRIANTQLPPLPLASDFSKKTGELCFAMHSQLPLLVVGWNQASSTNGGIAWSSMAVWQFGGNGSKSSIKWRVMKPSQRMRLQNSTECDLTGSIALIWLNDVLRVCCSYLVQLSLDTYLPLMAAPNDGGAKPSFTGSPRVLYSSTSALSLEQYHSYQDVPTTILQVTARSSSENGSGFVLRMFSLQAETGSDITNLLSLPEWKNYSGALLFPWELVTNSAQSVACVKLFEQGSRIYPYNGAFSYTVLEIKRSSGGVSSIQSNEDDNEGMGGQRSGYQVTCGAQLEALDVCVIEGAQSLGHTVIGDARRLLVLSITGKSLNFQTHCDRVDTTEGILLNTQARRIFTTPLPLSSTSSHFLTVGVRLLYLLTNEEITSEVLVLSEDDLSVPGANGYRWVSQPGEKILDVQWNSICSSSNTPTSAPLAAIWTTSRMVILSGQSMSEICTYSLANDLEEPHSALWLGQTLLISTQDHQLRYLTPMASISEKGDLRAGQLLCSLRIPGSGGSQTVQLLSVCGDRLCYAVTDTITGDCQTFVRPISLIEPLIMGFDKTSSPSALLLLRAIFEREVLTFLQATGTDAPTCPFSNTMLEATYYRFGWKKATIQVLQALLGRSADASASVAGTSTGATGSSTTNSSSGFSRASHLSRPLIAALLADAKKWRDALRIFVSDDPALEEYAFSDVGEDDLSSVSSAKLPSRTSQLAQWFRDFGGVMESIGQFDLAIKCFDLAGDDIAITQMLHRLHSSAKGDARKILTALDKDLATLNPPLATIVESTISNDVTQKDFAQLTSVVWMRQDLLTLLCCESLHQTERRSRLLTTVRPFNKMVMAIEDPQVQAGQISEDQERQAVMPAKVLQWKQLAPEDIKNWTGATSTAIKVTTDELKPLNYSLFASKSSSFLKTDISNAEHFDGNSMGGLSSPTSVDSNAVNNNKMTIGPFLEEEDAVVAYWRFEEGAAKSEEVAMSSLESMDTSKRENHLKLQGFGSSIKLVPSTAPVDRGEEGKLQEEFALQFPASTSEDSGANSEPIITCPSPTGGTLDVGFVFDEDPYRRKLTFEAWVRDYVLARELQQQQHEGFSDDESGEASSAKTMTGSRSSPNIRRPLVRRCDSDGSTIWWDLAFGDDSRLELSFGSARVRAESPVENPGTWHHVAFTVDVTASKTATLRLFLNAKCVAVQEVSSIDANANYYNSKSESPASMLQLGAGLRDYEMTEVRIWATARSAEQLSDMKENYLSMAEAKRRMKIAIHQRNCTCAKCTSRRAPPAAGAKKLSLASPFPSAPASTASARDRRRPVPSAAK